MPVAAQKTGLFKCLLWADLESGSGSVSCRCHGIQRLLLFASIWTHLLGSCSELNRQAQVYWGVFRNNVL